MYDAREKAIRDQQWALKASYLEGEARGDARGKIDEKVDFIRTLQGILAVPISVEQELRSLSLEQLASLTGVLQEKIRNRLSSQS